MVKLFEEEKKETHEGGRDWLDLILLGSQKF